MKKLNVVAMAVLAASCTALPASAQIQEAAITGGRVAGTVENDLSVFKGIPFAAPPVGPLRWKAPQPVTPWTGVLQATKFGPSCVQDENIMKMLRAPPEMSEDCLQLNVLTPAHSAGEKLPVMFWIYGGGFVAGQTSIPLTDGTRLAKKGVVVVSVSYRVGTFGFLAHPELSRESGKGSGDYGLQDQIAGLAWVKANIRQFGGDPNRVTIFGESAGGISVSMLAASPAAHGLFQGVISESGGNFGGPRYDSVGGMNVPPLKVAEANGQAFFAKLGAKTLADARALSAGAVQKAGGAGFWPVFDGDVLPGDQYDLYKAKRFNDTPVLVGTNSDEGSLFVQPPMTLARFEQQVRTGYGAGADAILAAYPHATDAEALQAARDLFRDTAFGWHSWAWAMLENERGRNKAFVYYFDKRPTPSAKGASHGAEVPYVFGTLGASLIGPTGPAPAPKADDHKLSDTIIDYWTNFVKTGDPNGSGLPKWPAFSPANQQVMVLDVQSAARTTPDLAKFKALDAYYAWRRSEEHAKKPH